MISINTLKIKNVFKQLMYLALFILALNILLRVLVYAVPLIIIIWLGLTGWKKLKGTVHERKGSNINVQKNEQIAEKDKIKDIFAEFNSTGTKVVDVDYEEIN